MNFDLIIQVLLTLVLVPVITGFNDYFSSKREKRHRFDEHRLDAYTTFAREIADVVWAGDLREAEARFTRAWIAYEAVALTSTAEVVASAIRVRHALWQWTNALKQSEDDGTEFPPFTHKADPAELYKALGEFHRVAREDMGLSPVDYERVEREARKYYDENGPRKLT
ncbi:MAG: hypothetical protein ACKOHO_03170 [Acidimicrobiaceae bacterium]